MNNSSIHPEEAGKPIEVSLAEREAQVVRIIESLQHVQDSPGWRSLKIELFDGLVQRTKNLIFTEARKENPDVLRLNRLSGQLDWAEKFADLGRLAKRYRDELTSIRINHGKTKI